LTCLLISKKNTLYIGTYKHKCSNYSKTLRHDELPGRRGDFFLALADTETSVEKKVMTTKTKQMFRLVLSETTFKTKVQGVLL